MRPPPLGKNPPGAAGVPGTFTTEPRCLAIRTAVQGLSSDTNASQSAKARVCRPSWSRALCSACSEGGSATLSPCSRRPATEGNLVTSTTRPASGSRFASWARSIPHHAGCCASWGTAAGDEDHSPAAGTIVVLIGAAVGTVKPRPRRQDLERFGHPAHDAERCATPVVRRLLPPICQLLAAPYDVKCPRLVLIVQQFPYVERT